jgi:DNA-binding beta-propeller fold protein YncE
VKAGLTVRNYGYYIDLGAHYTSTATPYKDHAVQAYATDPTLLTRTDPYFRSFDNNYPDLWRFDEWNREFQQFVKNGDLPNLTLLRYMHDHMGNFGSADNKKTGLSFPEAQQADDDLAVGKTLETIAHSPYAGNTLVFVVEDDSQDGPDHVNAHRSTAYIVGPYVKQGAVVSTRYNTVNMIRTIEDILRIDHLNLNDAYAAPMEDVFDLTQATWNFTAVASPFLRGTVDAVPGTTFADNGAARPARTAAWWAEQTKGFDWSKEDRVPAELFNRIIWRGFKGEARYPK